MGRETGGLRPLDSRGRLSPPKPYRLPCQLLQYFFPQLLRLTEKLLILDEQPVHLQRPVSGEPLAQNHVAHMHRVRQGCVFRQFFQRGIGIVVIHGGIVAPPSLRLSGGRLVLPCAGGTPARQPAGRPRYTSSVLHRSCRCTIPFSLPPSS